MDKVGRWFGPLSGLLFVAAVVIGNGIYGGLDAAPSNSAETVLAEFRLGADDIQPAVVLSMFGLGLFLMFLAYLRAKIRERSGWAADGLFAGGIVLAGAWILLLGVELAGGVAGEHGHAVVAQGALDFLWEGVYLFTPGLLAVGVAAAAASFVYRALPIWLGVFAVVVALGAFAPWVGVFVFIGWVLATSVVGLVDAFRPAAPAEAS